jgi:hypothetical protein
MRTMTICFLRAESRGIILNPSCCNADISFIYHYIRGQATIKLYVVYNVLEVLSSVHITSLALEASSQVKKIQILNLWLFAVSIIGPSLMLGSGNCFGLDVVYGS